MTLKSNILSKNLQNTPLHTAYHGTNVLKLQNFCWFANVIYGLTEINASYTISGLTLLFVNYITEMPQSTYPQAVNLVLW